MVQSEKCLDIELALNTGSSATPWLGLDSLAVHLWCGDWVNASSRPIVWHFQASTMSCSWFVLAVLLAVTVCGCAEASGLRKDASSLGGCAELGFCCQGKNNTCRVRRHHSDAAADDDDEQNSVLVLSRRNTCFCDSACVDLADCCHDYEQACARKLTSTTSRAYVSGQWQAGALLSITYSRPFCRCEDITV